MLRGDVFAVRLPEKLKERAKLYAKENDLSLGHVIRLAMEEFLRKADMLKGNDRE